MAPNKGATLSGMVDPISDDEFGRTDVDMMHTPDSQIENKPPTKRKVGRPKAAPAAALSKVTKQKVAARRTSGVSMPKKKIAAAGATKKERKALEERTNVAADGYETEEVDDFDEVPEKLKRGAKVEAAPVKQSKPGRKPKAVEAEVEAVASKGVKPSKATSAAPKKAGRPKRAPSPEIEETQGDLMDVEQTEITEMEETTVPEPEPEPVRKAVARQPTNQARASSRQPEPLASRHRRAGSASDTERAADPTLRRKLGEMTKKFENLDIKYRNLKELGMNESSSNFEKLRKSTEKKAKDQDDIIASLKKELASQRTLAAESKSLRAQAATLQAENQRLAAEQKSVSSSLHSAQNEMKALSAKLSQARNSVPPESSNKGPGSAVKDRRPGGIAAKHDEERQIMKLKEDLYSDLSGLMIHNVKRLEDQDVYDCIQTGRNGTLRFHLSISHFDPSTATPGPSFYDDAEFAYSPLLDEKNDRHLLEILPDYLTEEIVFPRNSAAKFYGKVVDCMSKKYED